MHSRNNRHRKRIPAAIGINEIDCVDAVGIAHLPPAIWIAM